MFRGKTRIVGETVIGGTWYDGASRHCTDLRVACSSVTIIAGSHEMLYRYHGKGVECELRREQGDSGGHLHIPQC